MQWQSISIPYVQDGGRATITGYPWNGDEPQVGDWTRSPWRRCAAVSPSRPSQACRSSSRCGKATGGSTADPPWPFFSHVRTHPTRPATQLHPRHARSHQREGDGRSAAASPGTGPPAVHRTAGGGDGPGLLADPYWFLPQSPDLIWSSDHSWCVATEIDFDSTLLGGDAALVDAVLADPALDAWPIDSEDCVGSSGDLINT